jgi:hypothetical protein
MSRVCVCTHKSTVATAARRPADRLRWPSRDPRRALDDISNILPDTGTPLYVRRTPPAAPERWGLLGTLGGSTAIRLFHDCAAQHLLCTCGRILCVSYIRAHPHVHSTSFAHRSSPQGNLSNQRSSAAQHFTSCAPFHFLKRGHRATPLQVCGTAHALRTAVVSRRGSSAGQAPPTLTACVGGQLLGSPSQ